MRADDRMDRWILRAIAQENAQAEELGDRSQRMDEQGVSEPAMGLESAERMRDYALISTLTREALTAALPEAPVWGPLVEAPDFAPADDSRERARLRIRWLFPAVAAACLGLAMLGPVEWAFNSPGGSSSLADSSQNGSRPHLPGAGSVAPGVPVTMGEAPRLDLRRQTDHNVIGIEGPDRAIYLFDLTHTRTLEKRNKQDDKSQDKMKRDDL